MAVITPSFNGTILTITVDEAVTQYKLNDRPWQVSNQFNNVNRGVNHIRILLARGEEEEFCIFFYNLIDAPESDEFTMSYSIETGMWISFHDYLPNIYMDNKEFFSIVNNAIYKHSDNDHGVFYGVLYPSYFDRVFNLYNEIEKGNTYWIKNIEWSTEKIYGDFPLRNQTIDKIEVRNQHQSTGLVSTKKVNCQNINGKWYFGEVRDSAKGNKTLRRNVIQDFETIGIDLKKFNQEITRGNIISPYIVVRAQMDNIDSGTIHIYTMKPNLEPAIR